MQGKWFYLIAILMIVISFVVYAISFEGRKIKTKDIVTLGVMVAIAVVARTAFFAVPHFKPMAGIVIICGIAFGMEAGFLCGALSMFISDFFFGQGIWTVWQMAAFGILGLLSGLLFNKLKLKYNRWILTAFGFVIIVVLVGPILDSSSLMFITGGLTMDKVWPVYIAGIPVNMIHGLATALILLFFGMPFIKQLDRIKKKYGIMEKEESEI